jgi:hypothetical protein
VPPALSEEYKLGAGDKLRIEVYKDTQLSQSVRSGPTKDHASAGRRSRGDQPHADRAARRDHEVAEGIHDQRGRHRHRRRGDGGNGLRDGRGLRSRRDEPQTLMFSKSTVRQALPCLHPQLICFAGNRTPAKRSSAFHLGKHVRICAQRQDRSVGFANTSRIVPLTVERSTKLFSAGAYVVDSNNPSVTSLFVV